MKFFNRHIILETQTSVIKRPIFAIQEITQMYEDVMKNLDTDLKVSKDVFDSFMIHDTLNPSIWENDTMKPEVKQELIKIAKDFFKGLKLSPSIKMKDILMVGSMANYNWSDFSDIDLHIVVDFSEFKEDEDFIKKYFDAEKNLWNNKHNIKIFGYDVELYVQELKEKVDSSAVYSVPNDKWIVKPEKTQFKLDKKVIKRKVENLFHKLEDVEHSYEDKNYQEVIDKIDNLKEYIKKMRKSGLQKGGEFSSENIIFKILRRTDFMEILDNYKNKAYDLSATLNEEQP
jgi:predicted nucleotidyltransferase